MRRSNWAPSIVPNGGGQTVSLVDDFGKISRAWRESDYKTTDPETVIQVVSTGQYSNLIRIDVARELRRCSTSCRILPTTSKSATATCNCRC
jgi:hypothetical protein